MSSGAVERVQKHVAEPSTKLPTERVWRIAAKRALLATGAEERPLVFGGNDRPGVMMAGAVSTYAKRYGVSAGKSVAIFTTAAAAIARLAIRRRRALRFRPSSTARPETTDVAPDGVRRSAPAPIVDTRGRRRHVRHRSSSARASRN